MAGISLEKNDSQEVVEENVCELSSREENAVEAPKEVFPDDDDKGNLTEKKVEQVDLTNEKTRRS